MAAYHNVTIIAKEGQWHIFLAFLPFALSVYFDFWMVLVYLFFAILAFSVYFFRNPEREVADDTAGSVLAPVDGTVSAIERLEDESGVRVRVDNTLLATHILRAPFKAEVTERSSRHGMAVWGDGETEQVLNNRCDIRFDNGVQMRVLGRLFPYAPTCHFGEGEMVRHAQRIGFLYTGTVELLLPYHTDLRISLGDHVTAAESIIGIIKE